MIKIVKLVTGEDIITEISAYPEKSTYELSSPASIVLQKTEQGVGVGLAAFMPYADGVVTLTESAVVAMGEPAVELRNEYSRLFGSGIQLMDSSLKL